MIEVLKKKKKKENPQQKHLYDYASLKPEVMKKK